MSDEAAAPDKRSYRVNFDLFKTLAPQHQPIWSLEQTIRELRDGLERMQFHDAHFRDSQFIRLKTLNRLREKKLLDHNLQWQSPTDEGILTSKLMQNAIAQTKTQR